MQDDSTEEPEWCQKIGRLGASKCIDTCKDGWADAPPVVPEQTASIASSTLGPSRYCDGTPPLGLTMYAGFSNLSLNSEEGQHGNALRETVRQP